MKNKSGSALVTLMIIVLLVSIAGSVMVSLARQQSFAVQHSIDLFKAQSYAEAGVAAAYSVLRQQFDSALDPSKFPLTSFSDGEYDVEVIPINSNLASIVSVGRSGNAITIAKVDVKNYTPGNIAINGGGTTPIGAYQYAIMSAGNMTWTGSGIIDVGNNSIQANGTYNMTGSKVVKGNIFSSTEIRLVGSTEVNGNITAPSIKVPVGAVTGIKNKQSVALISVPVLDLTPYYNEALQNGQVYNNNQSFSGNSIVNIPGGIMWVNGNFKYSGSGGIRGCIIATGSIDISGSGDQIKVNNYPAFISRDSSIDISGSMKSHGLIFARTTFDKTGSGKHIGSILCGGDFKGSGSWSELAYEDSTPIPPSNNTTVNNTVKDHVSITAWQQ